MDSNDIEDPTPSMEYAQLAEERWRQEQERLQKDIAQTAEMLSQHMQIVTEKDAQLARIELKLDEVIALLRLPR